MTAETLIETLRAQHRSLETDLDEESHRPSPDLARISALKREKLRIKDQISAMETTDGA